MTLNKNAAGKGKLGLVAGELIDQLRNNIEFKHILYGAGGLTAFNLINNILEETVDSAADLARKRYVAMNDPTWKEVGRAKLYRDYDDIARFTRAKEMLYNATYDKPLDLVYDQIGTALGQVQNNYNNQFRKGELEGAFESLKAAPEVKALGEARARMIFDQISKVSPDVMKDAPGTALSVFQSAIASDSTALRPDMVYNLARAQDILSG